MCLVVKTVPANKSTRRIFQCKKYLYYRGGLFSTPYYGVDVPNNGWLFPFRKYNGDFSLHQSIKGGLIHASWGDEFEFGDPYKAYAFGVEAFGTSDLVCRALYVPDADENAKETLMAIKAIMKRPRLDVMLKKLPILKRIEKHLC